MTSSVITPTLVAGVPLCSDALCASFDGKRCRLQGSRPGPVCVPAVAQMVATIADLEDRLRLLGDGSICAECQCAPTHASHPYLCVDCDVVSAGEGLADCRPGSCVAVGLRALCGRKVLPLMRCDGCGERRADCDLNHDGQNTTWICVGCRNYEADMNAEMYEEARISRR